MKKGFKKLIVGVMSAYITPTIKQKDAHGRLSHTLCAACFIGAVSVISAEARATSYVVFKIAALIFWGVLLFVVGSILSKGE